MKGLVGGIPLALLVAAVANGQSLGKRHGGHPGTVIGGPSGDDGGNSASIGFDSSYSSTVNEAYKDDHSFSLENHVVTPPHPPMPGFRKRGGGRGGVAIGGPSGDDGGNSANLEFDSNYSSTVNESYEDDHSIGIDNHVVTPPVHPIGGFRKRGERGGTAIGGSSGANGGNSADLQFETLYSSAVSESYEDDHSWGIDNKIITPPAPGFRKRGHGGGTAIGGPSGDDEGNSAGFGVKSNYVSTVTESYKDDHSVDIKNHVVTPPGFRKRGDRGGTAIGGPSGPDEGNSVVYKVENNYASSVDESYQGDHSVDIKNKIVTPPPPTFGHPGFRKRGGPGGTAIGGPSGDDGGNSANIKFDNDYLSEINEDYKDDHSFDLKNHVVTPPAIPGFRKRGGPGGTAIGGPSGNDGGNSVNIKFDNDYTSEINEDYQDDHSFDSSNHIVTPPAVPGFRKRGGGHGGVAIGGPSGDDGGNSANIKFDNDYLSEINEDYKDDHSFDLKNHIVTPPAVPGFRRRGDGGNSVGPGNKKNDEEKDEKHEGPSVISGPKGDDGGGSAELNFDNTYTSSVDESYEDNHSFDIKNHVVTPPPHLPMMPFVKRAYPTVIGGPSGKDEGNSANIEFDNDYSSAVNENYEDDHSFSSENTIVTPPIVHPPPVPHGPGFVPVPSGPVPGPQQPHAPGFSGGPGGPPAPGSPQPQNPGFPGGPGGPSGPGAPGGPAIPIPQQPQNPGFPGGPGFSGGPGGPPAPGSPQPQNPGFPGGPGGPSGPGAPGGPAIPIPQQPQNPGFPGGPGGPPSSGSQQPHNPGSSGGPGGFPETGHPSVPGQPQSPGSGGPPAGPPAAANPPVPASPHAPGFGGGSGNPHEGGHHSDPGHVSSKPCSTTTVREIITRTVREHHAEPTGPAVPVHGSPSSVPSAPKHSSVAVPTAEPGVPAHPVHQPSASVPQSSAGSYPGQIPGFSDPQLSNGFASVPSYSIPTGAYPSYAVPTGGFSNPEGSFAAPSAPSSFQSQPGSEYYYPQAPVHQSQAAAEPSSSHVYAITSTITVSRPSSFAVVPVHIPSAAASGSPTTPLLQRPSGADPMSNPEPSFHHQGMASPTPSSSTLFTGAAGRLAPAAGVMSALAGLAALLAFAL